MRWKVRAALRQQQVSARALAWTSEPTAHGKCESSERRKPRIDRVARRSALRTSTPSYIPGVGEKQIPKSEPQATKSLAWSKLYWRSRPEAFAHAMSARFVFAATQSGAERWLKNEVAREHHELRFAFSRPGFVTFRLPEA